MVADKLEELRRKLNIALQNNNLTDIDVLSISRQMDEIILEYIKQQIKAKKPQN